MLTFKDLEEQIARYPVCQYGFLETDRLIFSERVRYICRTECDRYGKSWSCPPAVGSVKECRKRCMDYSHVLVFTTLAEVSDTAFLAETLATRKGHEEVTAGLCSYLESRGEDFLALSSESCDLCRECSWPEHPCKRPEQMHPCIESHGILVTDSARLCGIDFFYDNTTVTWFGMIFFHAADDISGDRNSYIG